MGKRYTVSVKKEYWDALHEVAKSSRKSLADVVDSVMRGKAYLQVPGDAAPLAESPAPAAVPGPARGQARESGIVLVRVIPQSELAEYKRQHPGAVLGTLRRKVQ